MLVKEITIYNVFGFDFNQKEEADLFLQQNLTGIKEQYNKDKQRYKKQILPKAFEAYTKIKKTNGTRTKKQSNESFVTNYQSVLQAKNKYKAVLQEYEDVRNKLKEIYDYETSKE